MKQGMTLLAGLGLGAGLMYFLDPYLGRRRRSLVRDQFLHVACQFDDCLDATWKDLRNRAQGLAAEASSLLRHDGVPDEVLVERVRAKLGRYVSHPHAVAVAARDGRVTLSGRILAREVPRLLSAVASVRGVKGVDNRLEGHPQAGHIPDLQGGQGRPGERPNLLQDHWAPATRLLVGAAGRALLAYGCTQRFPVACLLGTAGLALLARSGTNLSLSRLLGVGCGRRALEIQKTITVHAPRDEVFRFWANYQNFSRFKSLIEEGKASAPGKKATREELEEGYSVGPAVLPVSS